MSLADIITIVIIILAIIGAFFLNRYRKRTSNCCGCGTECNGKCIGCAGCGTDEE